VTEKSNVEFLEFERLAVTESIVADVAVEIDLL